MNMHWLNGWRKEKGNDQILVGTSICCIGCGRSLGTVCVVIDETHQCPSKEPDWPFLQNDCPVCIKEYRGLTPEDIAKYSLSILRKAIKRVKAKREEHDGIHGI